MKKYLSFVLIGLVFLFLFNSSCSQLHSSSASKSTTDSSNYGGLAVNFQNPISHMTKTSTYSLFLNVKNNGDYDVPASNFQATMISSDFEVPSPSKKLSSDLPAAKNPQFASSGQVSWDNIKYSSSIPASETSVTGKYNVQYSYVYGGQSQVGFCLINQKLFYNPPSSGCNPSSIDVSNSKALIGLKSVKENKISSGTYIVDFTFEKLTSSEQIYPFMDISSFNSAVRDTQNLKQGILIKFDLSGIFDGSKSFCYFDSGKTPLNQLASFNNKNYLSFSGLSNTAVLSCHFYVSAGLTLPSDIGLKKYGVVMTRYVVNGQKTGSVTVENTQ